MEFKYIYLIPLLALSCIVHARYPWFYDRHIPYQQKGIAYKTAHFLGEVLYDVLRLNAYLFSVQSVKVITGFSPFYLGARWMDEALQNNFYDPTCHKNINQLPEVCHKAAQHAIGAPMVFLSGLWLYGWTEDLRQTGRMIAIGLPFVHCGKDIIKKLRFKCCLRPWHENFSKHKRSSGGFPSGHMANATYMTSLMWMRHGIKWGLPLSFFMGLVFIDFLNCNRHYFSQLIAGAGLGLLFAYAANRVVDAKLAETLTMRCGVDDSGCSMACLTFRF